MYTRMLIDLIFLQKEVFSIFLPTNNGINAKGINNLNNGHILGKKDIIYKKSAKIIYIFFEKDNNIGLSANNAPKLIA